MTTLRPTRLKNVSTEYVETTDLDFDNDYVGIGSDANEGKTAKMLAGTHRDAIAESLFGVGFGTTTSFQANATLTADLNGGTVDNSGATSAITLTLMEAVAGRSVVVKRSEPYLITLAPDGLDFINGSPSTVVVTDPMMVLDCVTGGQWEISFGSSDRVVNVRKWGAVGNGDSGDADTDQAAFEAAIATGLDVYVPEGTFFANNLTLAAYQTIRGAGRNSIIKKSANGPVLTLGRESDCFDLKIDGDGANYTGAGIVIPATAEYEGEQRVSRCWIIDTASYCIQYTGQFSGFGSSIIQCILSPRDYTTTACVKWSGLEVASNQHGDRTILGCVCNGPIVDASSSNVGYITNCISGDSGSLGPVICDSLTGTLTVTGSRLVGPLALKGYSQTWTGNIHSSTVTASSTERVQIGNSLIAGDLTISGNDVIVSGSSLDDVSISGDRNIISGCRTYAGTNFTLASGAEYNRVADCYIDGTFTDSSGNVTNLYDLPAAAYTPSWTAATANPVLGSSTITGRYSRRGNMVTAVVKLAITTGGAYSAGTGDYYFSLPFVPSTVLEEIGIAHLYDSGNNYRVGAVRTLTDGTARMQLYVDSEGQTADPTHPITFATGDTLYLTITYMVN